MIRGSGPRLEPEVPPEFVALRAPPLELAAGRAADLVDAARVLAELRAEVDAGASRGRREGLEAEVPRLGRGEEARSAYERAVSRMRETYPEDPRLIRAELEARPPQDPVAR